MAAWFSIWFPWPLVLPFEGGIGMINWDSKIDSCTDIQHELGPLVTLKRGHCFVNPSTSGLVQLH